MISNKDFDLKIFFPPTNLGSLTLNNTMSQCKCKVTASLGEAEKRENQHFRKQQWVSQLFESEASEVKFYQKNSELCLQFSVNVSFLGQCGLFLLTDDKG